MTTSTFPTSSSSPSGAALALGPALVRVTGRGDGDLRAPAAVLPGPVAWFRAVHGARVLEVDRPGLAGEADGLVTTVPGLALLTRAADCGMVVMAPAGGAHDAAAVGVAHAGWRGVVDGIVGALASGLRRHGIERMAAVLGPCIGPCCYEFGERDLAAVEAATGADVRGTTSDGRLALDLRAALCAACVSAGVDVLDVDPRCTACHDGGAALYSHRARGDAGRHGMAAWLR